MKTRLSKIAFAIVFGLSLSFAQISEKLAVYVSGASEAGINKSLGNKLLVTMVRSGIYSEISDLESFHNELAKSGKNDLASIIQVAKRYSADYVCVVNMVEVFGAYSFSGRLIKIEGSQIVKTGLTDRSLKSIDDLTAVSNELSRQLLPPTAAAIVPSPPVAVAIPPAALPPPQIANSPPVAKSPPIAKQPAINSNAPYAFLASGSFGEASQPVASAPVAVSPTPAQAQAPALTHNNMPIDRVAAAQAAAKKQCAKTYNINEVIFNLKEGFPTQLKGCATDLAKNMGMSFIPGRKKPEPKSFMQQCAVDGVRNEIPDGFPNTDKIIGSVDNFVQGILNSAMAGGTVDPKKLLNAVASMNITDLLNDVKRLASGPCVVNEPY